MSFILMTFFEQPPLHLQWQYKYTYMIQAIDLLLGSHWDSAIFLARKAERNGKNAACCNTAVWQSYSARNS